MLYATVQNRNAPKAESLQTYLKIEPPLYTSGKLVEHHQQKLLILVKSDHNAVSPASTADRTQLPQKTFDISSYFPCHFCIEQKLVLPCSKNCLKLP